MAFIIARLAAWFAGINLGSVLAFLASPAGIVASVALLTFGAYGYGKHVEGREARAAVQASIEKAKGADKDIAKDAAIQGAEDRAANAGADAERDRRIRDYEAIIANLKERGCVLSSDDVRRLERVRPDARAAIPLPPRRP